MWVSVYVLCVVSFALCASSDTPQESQVAHEQKWRAVDTRSETPIDWIPADGPIPSDQFADGEPVIVKRRRVRKRKRRPQNFERDVQDEQPFNERLPPRPRLRRPRPDLDQQRDQWGDEMMAEEPFRPVRVYKRRRLYPKYEEQESKVEIEPTVESQIEVEREKEETKSHVIEKIRDPYTALREENKKISFPRRKIPEEVTDQPTSTKFPEVSTTHAPIDLKAILKQAGGISLSELLQQRNLSLNDLLTGKQHAISALTKMHDEVKETSQPKSDITEEIKPKRFNGYRRIPPSQNKKNLDDTENYPPQKEHKYKFTEFKPEIITEATTERRIFVPSHPKYYTSINFKPDMKVLNADISSTFSTLAEVVNDEENSVETTPVTSTTKAPKSEPTKPTRKITLPPTLAKMRTKYQKTTVKPTIKQLEIPTENYPKVAVVPDNAMKINLNDLFGISNVLNEQKTTDGPLKLSINIHQIEDPVTENIIVSKTISTTESFLHKAINKLEIVTTEPFEPEKLKPTSAKEEIQEILSDTMSRENLLNILEARNMTIKELMDQRERGSSQRHLADIFHNQTREPEPQETVSQIINKPPFVGLSSLETMFSQKNFFQSSNEDSSENVFPNISPTNRESRQHQIKKQEDYSIINNPLFRTDLKTTNEVINKLIPVWREAYSNMQNNEAENEAKRVEQIENQLAEAVNGALNEVEITNKLVDDEDYLQLPSGVRSAMIASATIVGISLLVFITIFVIFKLSQKKHKRLSYSNSLSSLKIRSPILETDYQKRIFGSLMNSSLGRKKKVSTISSSEPQSIQDYLWEVDRKPFQ